MLIDPRLGDFEDDVSSTKQRSLFSIAGSMLTEISIPKLIFAWVLSIALPAILLGLAPLAATAWAATLTDELASFTGIGTVFSSWSAPQSAGSAGGRSCAWRRRISGRSMRLPYSPAMRSSARPSVI